MSPFRAVPLWRRAARGIACMIIFAAALGCSSVTAQPAVRPRIALVVGVAAYKFVPALANPANDARAAAAALTRLGFEVDAVVDPDRGALESAIRRLGQRARGAEAAVVFYAGHALEVGGHNWLLPIGANPSTERDLRYEALDMDGLLEQLDNAAPVTIVLVDACRDNPFRMRFGGEGRGTALGGGLAPARAATGTLVAFATAPGMVARDGSGVNSPFTTALLRHIELPGVEVRKLMADVRKEVRELTRGQQIPWEHSALEGEFYFKPAAAVPQAPRVAVAIPAAPGPEAELAFWQGVRDSADPADLHEFLGRFPEGMFAPLARNRLARLNSGLAAAAPLPSAAPAAPPLLDRLLAVLERTGDRVAAPYSAQWGRSDAQRYTAASPHKAIAVEPNSGRLFRQTGLPSSAMAEQFALEGCQHSYGAPCVLVASDGDVRSTDPRNSVRTAMPRIAYAGELRPDMVPMTRMDALPDAVRRYPGMTGPKALALRVINQRYATGSGASANAAEAAALEACNAEPSSLPCVLYATADRVILPQRRTEAMRVEGAAR